MGASEKVEEPDHRKSEKVRYGLEPVKAAFLVPRRWRTGVSGWAQRAPSALLRVPGALYPAS